MSTTLEQLRVERDYLLNLLKDLKKQVELDTTSEATYTILHNEYEAKLRRVERDIAHHELHQDPEHIAPQHPATETDQATETPHGIKSKPRTRVSGNPSSHEPNRYVSSNSNKATISVLNIRAPPWACVEHTVTWETHVWSR